MTQVLLAKWKKTSTDVGKKQKKLIVMITVQIVTLRLAYTIHCVCSYVHLCHGHAGEALALQSVGTVGRDRNIEYSNDKFPALVHFFLERHL